MALNSLNVFIDQVLCCDPKVSVCALWKHTDLKHLLTYKYKDILRQSLKMISEDHCLICSKAKLSSWIYLDLNNYKYLLIHIVF